MTFGGSMPMPFVAVFAPDHPIGDAFDDGFVGRKHIELRLTQFAGAILEQAKPKPPI